jgi:spoIIIJ-associated protein
MTDNPSEGLESAAVDSAPANVEATDTQALVDRQGDVAADYLEGLLDILDLDGDIEIEVQPGRAVVSVVESSSGELQHLVGQDGSVLMALQDLTRLAVTADTGARAHITLDIAGHRARKKDMLRKVGQAAVEEAKATGQPVRLAAMTPFERKIIHDTAADAGLTSESEGTEPNRYVVIRPQND